MSKKKLTVQVDGAFHKKSQSAILALQHQKLTEAIDAHQSGRFGEAERLYKAIIAADNRGEMLPAQEGAAVHATARHPFREMPTVKYDDPSQAAHRWLGVLLLQCNQVDRAASCLHTALRLAPDDFVARINLGKALSALRQFDQAIAVLKDHEPGSNVDGGSRIDTSSSASMIVTAALQQETGHVFLAAGRPAEALSHYDQALSLVSQHSDQQAKLHNARGLALSRLDRFGDATQAYRTAIALQPSHAGWHNNLGLAIKAQGLHEEAMWHFRDALRIDPDFVPALINLGHSVALSRDYDQASAPLERAVALAPEAFAARLELGNVYSALGRYREAAEQHALALEIDPSIAIAHQNFGASCFELGEMDRAFDAFESALARRSDMHLARFCRGSILLAREDYRAGYADYESRQLVWRSPRYFEQPAWPGLLPASDQVSEPGAPCAHGNHATRRDNGTAELAGLTILVHADQGLGDTLQFYRFVPSLASLGARVILDVQPALQPLLAANVQGYDIEIMARGAALPPVDYHCPLESLPYLLRVDSMPSRYASQPPYLHACTRAPLTDRSTSLDAKRQTQGLAATLRQWAKHVPGKVRIVDAHRRLRIGIAWSGRSHPAARHSEQDSSTSWLLDPATDKRAISLQLLEGLFDLDGIEWHVLQTEIADTDRETLELLVRDGMVRHASADFADFLDTARYMTEMDQVLTVDTSIAHLAGAMAVPTNVLLPYAADWRWAATSSNGHSKWYPSVRAVRQSRLGDWSGPIEIVRNTLANAVSRRRPS